MRAIFIDQCGGPERMRIADLPVPEPGPGEILIKVTYAGVNPADWKAREGWLAPFFSYQFPFVLGFDMAGTVAALGPGVGKLRVGQRVVAYSKQGMGAGGSYAEYALAFAQAAVPLPGQVSLIDATTLPTAGVTAYESVVEAGVLRRGAKLLVHGGAGDVGSYAIQLGRNAGANVAATCRSENADYVRGLGAQHAFDYRNGTLLETVRAWAGDGVDLVVDAVGQGTLPQAVEMTRPGGRIAAIATLVRNEPAHDAASAARRGVMVVPTTASYERMAGQLAELVGLLAERRLRAPAIETLPLEQAAEAHRRVQAGHVRGKLVLQVGT